MKKQAPNTTQWDGKKEKGEEQTKEKVISQRF